jgi:hypothetical protein
MYAKIQDFKDAHIFVINFFKIWFKGISYEVIMHKNEFGQAHCKDLLNRILWKFILYFSEFYSVYYEYLKFGWILGFKSIQK